MTEPLSPSYPAGLRIFLRTQNKESELHFIDLPKARGFGEPSGLINVLDEFRRVVGVFPLDAVSAMLPLEEPEIKSSAKN